MELREWLGFRGLGLGFRVGLPLIGIIMGVPEW